MSVVRGLAGAVGIAACLFPACRAATPVRQTAPIVQPGAPGEPSRIIDAAHAVDLSKVRFTSADVEFMQGMISHHAQAIEMTDLVEARTGRPDMRTLAARIALSQSDEIRMMQEWLTSRDQAGLDQHVGHAGAMMPGMLTPEQMQRLASARGPEFDRFFLEGMITHHHGALTMVETLMRQPGAAEDSEIFEFVSDVVADQRAEIERMGAMMWEFTR